MMEMEEAETIDLYELQYSDLSSPSTSSMVDSIMEALEPTVPGLLAVPIASNLRSHLLPLSRKLALLDLDTRKLVLKEHNLGSDVPLRNPDRSVSPFAMQLKYAKSQHVQQTVSECYGMEFENLGRSFKELGFCMMELGLCLARICDKAIGGNELEQSLLDSYLSSIISIYKITNKHERSKATSKRRGNNVKPLEGSKSNSIACSVNSGGNHSNLWQQWHYDYGIFTVLTTPLFILPSYSETSKTEDTFSESCFGECPSPTGHTCLQIYDPNKPSKFENLSRENFVVFLQPAWTKTFSISDYHHANSTFNGQLLVATDEEQEQSERDSNNLSQEIKKIVPPLSSRLKEGMTFAEFSRETTKQFYGGSGLQSNR
ncbi:hypothetical protein HKD37_10G027175 [Glycine soja]